MAPVAIFASPPSRGRGLKLTRNITASANINVAPFAGAWIETFQYLFVPPVNEVAPFAGAWIETMAVIGHECSVYVAPFAGAWIETQT